MQMALTQRSTRSKDSSRAEQAELEAQSETAEQKAARTIRWLAIAEVAHGMTGCVLVSSTVTDVDSYQVLAVGQEADAAEAAWEEASYHLLFRREPLPDEFLARAAEDSKPFTGSDVVGAWGYALERERPRSGNWGIIALRTEGPKIIAWDLASMLPDWLYAWQELEALARRNLIRQDRRKV